MCVPTAQQFDFRSSWLLWPWSTTAVCLQTASEQIRAPGCTKLCANLKATVHPHEKTTIYSFGEVLLLTHFQIGEFPPTQRGTYFHCHMFACQYFKKLHHCCCSGNVFRSPSMVWSSLCLGNCSLCEGNCIHSVDASRWRAHSLLVNKAQLTVAWLQDTLL